MPDLPLATGWVKIANGDLQIDAYLAQPEASGPWPAVIVFQEIFGVNHHIRDVTERVAAEGYVAIAPAIYQRFAPGFETGYTPTDVELGRRYKDQTTAAELVSDTQATIAYLQGLPQVKSSAIATIGFCFGGHVAYLVATLPSRRQLLSTGLALRLWRRGAVLPRSTALLVFRGHSMLSSAKKMPVFPANRSSKSQRL